MMTVPSCKVHNNDTSTADEHLRFMLSAGAMNVPQAVTDVAFRGVMEHVLKRSRTLPRYGLDWENEALSVGKDFPIDFELLNVILSKIARALYFDHHCGRKKLLGDLKVFPLFIPDDPSSALPEHAAQLRFVREATAQDFEEHPKLGPHQEIFAYQIFDTSGLIVVNMEFYGTNRASVMSLAV